MDQKKENLNEEDLYQNYNLNLKIEGFLTWSHNHLAINREELRKFIMKMAFWYEMRYPRKELAAIFGLGDLKEPISSFPVDFNVFFETLNDQEKKYLKEHTYNKYNYINRLIRVIHLKADGEITKIISTKDFSSFVGLNIVDFYSILMKNKLVDDANIVKHIIKEPYYWQEFQEQLLNCVMYQIIEFGKSIDGVQRGFLFAKEFGRDINIPLRYYQNDGNYQENKNLMKAYLKMGGLPDLPCANGYFMKKVTEVPLNSYFSWLNVSVPKQKKL